MRVEPLSDGSGSRVVLHDGRTIGIREAGDPRGWPLVLFPGTPGSRLTSLADLDSSFVARVIVLERPGFGVSSPQPSRRIVDWPSDVARVADVQGLDAVAIAGMSGAGPYLAATAHALPTAFGPSACWGSSRRMKIEAFRQGPAALAQELALAARPWGVPLDDIRVPVHVWHGELDVSTPIAMGRCLAHAIPGSRAHFIPDAGHFLAYTRWAETLTALAPQHA